MCVGDSKDLDQICVLESRSGIPGQDPKSPIDQIVWTEISVSLLISVPIVIWSCSDPGTFYIGLGHHRSWTRAKPVGAS